MEDIGVIAAAAISTPGPVRTMASQELLQSLLYIQDEARVGWIEPDGWLTPTEPDADERRLIRMRLDVQIATLMMVLGYPRDEIEAVNRRAEGR
jgi:hypothetical protein